MKKIQNTNNPFLINQNIQCKHCGGKLTYLYSGTYKCDDCGLEDMDDFGKIKKYIEENGPSPGIIISRATGVSMSVINDYLRQGRVEIPDGSPHYIKCEKCGTDIRYGRFCPSCAGELAGEIKKAFYNEAVGEKPKEIKGKMRFFDR